MRLLPLVFNLLFLTASSISAFRNVQIRRTRSVDLSATHTLHRESKLPGEVKPESYTLIIKPILEESSFTGNVKIVAKVEEPTNKIVMHAAFELDINENEIKLFRNGTNKENERISIRRVDRVVKKSLLEIYLKNTEMQGSAVIIDIEFSGKIYENTEGIFISNYQDSDGEKRKYLATSLRPNNARKLFPCFDEPSIKTKFDVSILRPKSYFTLFNTPLKSTKELPNDYQLDCFETTPYQSTYTIGFLISKLNVVQRKELNDPDLKDICIKVYARDDLHTTLLESNIYNRIEKSLKEIRSYFDTDFPLQKLDIVALPNFYTVKAVDNWGLIFYKESELSQNSIFLIAQELVYQWIGGFVTPYWWNDFHTNKALADFIAANTALVINGGKEFDGKWPMTILYSIYYEFSKRYPHSRITGMKQEAICSKTELVLRMINLTLGEETFKKGLQSLMHEREYKSFFTDEIWTLLTKQAHHDGKLKKSDSVNVIVESWLKKDRLPMINVQRNYENNDAVISQKLFLRERPHDVLDQDKMVWWIPIIYTTENELNFMNFKPIAWMRNEKQIKIENISAKDKFIIVNYEEIGPFPVNYDEPNWNMIGILKSIDYVKLEYIVPNEINCFSQHNNLNCNF